MLYFFARTPIGGVPYSMSSFIHSSSSSELSASTSSVLPITLAIIALGIASLIGIRTAMEAISEILTESLFAMGVNGFYLALIRMLFRCIVQKLPLTNRQYPGKGKTIQYK